MLVTTVYVVVRTAVFCPAPAGVRHPSSPRMPLDSAMVAHHLSAVIQCETVPRDDQGTPDPAAFDRLHQVLSDTYPLVHKMLKREVISGYSLTLHLGRH